MSVGYKHFAARCFDGQSHQVGFGARQTLVALAVVVGANVEMGVRIAFVEFSDLGVGAYFGCG